MLLLQHHLDVTILANTQQFNFDSLNLLIVGGPVVNGEKRKEDENDGVLAAVSENDEKKEKKEEKKKEKKNENKNELNDSSL